jgi:carboxylesterase type B
LANKTGCSGDKSLSCLQQVSAAEIKQAVEDNGLQFLPVFDNGVTVAGNELSSRKTVPLMIGSNYQDGLGVFPDDLDLESILKRIPLGETMKKGLINRYHATYPYGTGKEFRNLKYADAGLITDIVFNCVSSCT